MLLAGGLLRSKTSPKPLCNLKRICSELFYSEDSLHSEFLVMGPEYLRTSFFGCCSPADVLRSVWTSGEVALGSSVCPSIPWCVQCRGWGDALSPPGRRWSLTCFGQLFAPSFCSKKPIAKTICKG